MPLEDKFQPLYPLADKAHKSSHDPFDVKCGSCEHDIDRVSEKALIEVSTQTMVILAMSDDRLNSCPLPEEFVFLCPGVSRI